MMNSTVAFWYPCHAEIIPFLSFLFKINKGSFVKNEFHLVNNFDLCNYFCDFS